MDVKQNNLIKSLIIQPIIVVIRLENDFFDIPNNRDKLFLKIKKLSNYGIKNIEIAWDLHPEWINLLSEIKNNFNELNIGAASISSFQAFSSSVNIS